MYQRGSTPNTHLGNNKSETAPLAAKVRISHQEKILRGLVKDRLKTMRSLNPRIKALPWPGVRATGGMSATHTTRAFLAFAQFAWVIGPAAGRRCTLPGPRGFGGRGPQLAGQHRERRAVSVISSPVPEPAQAACRHRRPCSSSGAVAAIIWVIVVTRAIASPFPSPSRAGTSYSTTRRRRAWSSSSSSPPRAVDVDGATRPAAAAASTSVYR
jgi:hypothetical protein